MADIRLFGSSLNGKVTVCSSKSVAHRAIIAGALSGRDMEIKNVDYSKDIEATIDGLRALGIDITFCDSKVIIKKSRLKRNSSASFNAKESGSTLRFLIPVFVALNNESKFLGEGRLPKRPLDDYFEIFDKENVSYEKGEDYLPLKTKGTFQGSTFFVKGNVSSQFITGLMLSAIACEREVTIKITTNLESKPYVEITKKILTDFGHKVSFENNEIRIKRGETDINSYYVENDWSQAAFFLAAGAVSGDVTVCNMDLTSMQGDKEIVDILEKMGADVIRGDSFVRVKKTRLSGVKTDVSQIPDLVPILSVLGANAEGITEITNAKRLRIKESDRLLSVSEMLKGAGVKTEMGEDYLKIYGADEFSDSRVDSFNDHRIVMSASIMALNAKKTEIENYKAVFKSYPEFFKDYFEIGGKGEFLNE